MALARYRGTATDASGNTLASPTVEVRRESDNGLASLFSDRNGASGIGNSFTGNADGTFDFHVVGGAYKITITQGANSRVLRYVAIGTLAEHDEADLETAAAMFYDVKADFGAVGDQVTDDTAAIQNALNTVPASATLFFPEGYYSVLGSGASALTRNAPLNIVGAGYGSTGIFFPGSVPSSRDMLTFTATGGTYQGIHIHDIGFLSFGLGGNTLVVDGSGGNSPATNFIYQVHLHDVLIGAPSSGKDSIRLRSVAYSTIERCNLGSIFSFETGDTLVIRENILGDTARNCVDVVFVSGAGGFQCIGNVIAGTAAHVRVRNGNGPIIAFNEFETPAGQSNTNGFLVELGDTGEIMVGAVLLANQYSVLPSTSNPVPIRVRSGVTAAQVRESRLLNQTGAHVQVDSGASGTVIDRSVLCYVGANQSPVSVTDSGTDTKYLSPVALIMASSNAAGSDVSTAQTWFPSGGSITVLAASYQFEGVLMFSKTAGTNSRTIAQAFGGTATVSAIAYAYDAAGVDTTVFNGTQNTISGYVETVSAQTVYGIPSTSADQLVMVKVRGRVTFSAAGTFIPQFKYSAAPGGAPTVRANSFFRMWESRG